MDPLHAPSCMLLALASLTLGLAPLTAAEGGGGPSTAGAVQPGARDAEDLATEAARWHGASWAIKVRRDQVGPEGRDGLRIQASEPQWHLLKRTLVFPAAVARIVLTGEACAQGIAPANEAWKAGRIGALFLDANGGEIGGAPELAACLGGTTAWTPFRQELAAPAGTTAITLAAGVLQTTGTFFLRAVRVAAFDRDGKRLEPAAQEGVRNDTSVWLPLAIGPEDATRPLVLDFTSLRPAPAGRDGFVTREGGTFTVGGKPIRFWGENIGWKVMDWTKPELERQADWLARIGCNLVRLPFLDNSWGNNLFVTAADNTLTLDPAKLDRIDFFVAACRKRGLYLYGDLLVYRQFKQGDGVRDWNKLSPGAPVACQFNRRLIDLQKAYASALLGHVNPYTGLRWADDPAIAMLCMANEATTFWRDGVDRLPPSYLAELEELFAAWCRTGARAKPAAPLRELMKRSDATVCAFLKQVQDDFFAEMHRHLRQELGVKFLLAGSNHWENHIGDVMTNAGYDYLDRHSYWDHPGSSPYTEMSVFHNRPMLKARTSGNLIAQNARQRVVGLPFMVTEWNCCWPNEWCGEGPLLMAANGLFQDWQGLIHFSTEEIDWDGRLTSCFNTRNKPQQIAPLATSALLWLRGDVAAGPLRTFAVDTSRLDDAMGEAVTAEACLGARTGAVLGGATPGRGDGVPYGRQIAWSDDGVFTVDTPCTKAVLGFAGGREVALGGCTIAFTAPFGQAILTSLDHQPVERSRRLLLCALARVENTGQVFKDFKHGLLDAGRAPMLVEPFPVRVSFRRDAGQEPPTAPRLRAVDWYGRRMPGDLPITTADGRISLSLDGSRPYAWYEIACE